MNVFTGPLRRLPPDLHRRLQRTRQCVHERVPHACAAARGISLVWALQSMAWSGRSNPAVMAVVPSRGAPAVGSPVHTRSGTVTISGVPSAACSARTCTS